MCSNCVFIMFTLFDESLLPVRNPITQCGRIRRKLVKLQTKVIYVYKSWCDDGMYLEHVIVLYSVTTYKPQCFVLEQCSTRKKTKAVYGPQCYLTVSGLHSVAKFFNLRVLPQSGIVGINLSDNNN